MKKSLIIIALGLTAFTSLAQTKDTTSKAITLNKDQVKEVSQVLAATQQLILQSNAPVKEASNLITALQSIIAFLNPAPTSPVVGKEPPTKTKNK